MQAEIGDSLTKGNLFNKAVPGSLRNQLHRADEVVGGHAQFVKVGFPRAANAVESDLEWLAESSSNQCNVGCRLFHEGKS